jgi:ParB family chromosome partitioning protein
MMAEKLGKSRSSMTEMLSLTAMPDDVRELCRLADIHSKSVLLQVVRQGDSAKMISFLERLQQEGTTRAEARRLTRQVSKKKPRGRPKNYTFNYAPKGEGIALSLKFKKPEVEPDEIIQALEAVIESLRRQSD